MTLRTVYTFGANRSPVFIPRCRTARARSGAPSAVQPASRPPPPAAPPEPSTSTPMTAYGPAPMVPVPVACAARSAMRSHSRRSARIWPSAGIQKVTVISMRRKDNRQRSHWIARKRFANQQINLVKSSAIHLIDWPCRSEWRCDLLSKVYFNMTRSITGRDGYLLGILDLALECASCKPATT